jgi:S1-C subfamily serine protease
LVFLLSLPVAALLAAPLLAPAPQPRAVAAPAPSISPVSVDRLVRSLVAVLPAGGGYASGYVARCSPLPDGRCRVVLVTCAHLFHGAEPGQLAEARPARPDPDAAYVAPFSAVVAWADASTDVAVLVGVADAPLPSLDVAPADPAFGDPVAALGFPVTGPDAPWASRGAWCAPDRAQSLTAPGSSGGPVVDALGRVVGLARAWVPQAPGLAFLVPRADVARALVASGELR